jgi:hypothetical protein
VEGWEFLDFIYLLLFTTCSPSSQYVPNNTSLSSHVIVKRCVLVTYICTKGQDLKL